MSDPVQCADFNRLCDLATIHGWHVGLTTSGPAERNEEGGVHRRELHAIRLRQKPKGPIKISVVIAGDLAEAARDAQELLLDRVSK